MWFNSWKITVLEVLLQFLFLHERVISIVVTTTHGKLLGRLEISREGRAFQAFRGIPFAQPPTGNLRFEPPLPVQPWEGIRPAIKNAPACYQLDAMITGQLTGSEDCLYLNVFSPLQGAKAIIKFPIIFYIYGGGFASGDGSQFAPDYWMDFDVVVVTVNYRLGALGFLNTGDEVIAGNMAFKDQNLALRWIKDNAEQFGGDPERLTLAGQSSGALSVHLHMLSKMSQGLFYRAIFNSGTPFGVAEVQDNPAEQARYAGRLLSCPVENMRTLSDCLKSRPAEDIGKLSIPFLNPFKAPLDRWTFTIEAQDGPTAFLPAHPNDILAAGNFSKIPIIMGVNSGDGAILTAALQGQGLLSNLDSAWSVYAPLLIRYDPSRMDVSRSLFSYFFPHGRLPSKNLYNLTRFLSLTNFWEDGNYVANIHSHFAPVHLFYFNYISEKLLNLYYILKQAKPFQKLWPLSLLGGVVDNYITEFLDPENDPNRLGVVHAGDLPYLWKVIPVLLEIKKWDKEFAFSKEFVRVLVDFSGGSDSLTFRGTNWDPVDPGNTLCYLEMKKGSIRMIDEPFEKEVRFIRELNFRDRLI